MQSTDSQGTRSIESSGPERVKRAVVDAARKLFAEKGIHAVSVREIAREVGVSHTLLHLYFGSKEEILRQVLATASDMDPCITDELGAREAGETVFQAFVSNPDQVRVLAAAIMEGFVPDKIPFEPTIGKELAERLASLGHTEGMDPKLLSAMIASSAIGWAVAGSWISDSFGVDGETHQRAVQQMIGQAIDGAA